jgi:hypothetical protein
MAFNTQAQRCARHRRSSSFSGFVQRILPSHREEKGHTLRSQYDLNSNQDPVKLVFGVPISATPDKMGIHDLETGDGGVYSHEHG